MDDPTIQASNLTKNFKGFHAVNGISLSVRSGTIHALIGANGAGKTTCFNLISKFLAPTSGSIRFKGRDITHYKPDRVARSGVVRSFQISAVFASLTAMENVSLALQRQRGESLDFWNPLKVLDAHRGRAEELLEQVGLGDYLDTPARELPYGRKRALEIATTLGMDPEVMLLDEPTAGMATEDVSRITQLIQAVARGRTVLMVEHNLSVVSELCDWVTVLARGEVLVEGDYDTVARDERVIESYIGGGGHG